VDLYFFIALDVVGNNKKAYFLLLWL